MVQVSYPGVYIQEIPSGVRTIVGVDTSIAAFVGYTQRGPTNKAVEIFNFGDYERQFGGLHTDSDVSYAVQHYFLNGGARAWIVRVAAGAAAAAVRLENDVDGAPVVVLDASARSEGLWGNYLRLEVDYDTSNPASLFNIRVIELVETNGVLQPARTEIHRNLSMNRFSGNFAINAINAASELVSVSRPAGALAAMAVNGTSQSGELTLADLGQFDDDHRRLAVTIDGDGPHEFDVFDAGGDLAPDLNDQLDELAGLIAARVSVIKPVDAFSGFTCVRDGSTILATSGTLADDHERSSVRFTNAGTRNVAGILKLGVMNGGREVDAAAVMRPSQSGTAGVRIPDLDFSTLNDATSINVTIQSAGAADDGPHTLSLWTSSADKPTNLEELRSRVDSARSGASQAALNQGQVKLIDSALVVVPGGSDPNARLHFQDSGGDTTATGIGLVNGAENVGLYALGVGATSQAQTDAVLGNDGTPPGTTELIGSRSDKTGFYALEDADLFNILCIPNQSNTSLLSQAQAYAEERRAFMIIDLPENVDTLPEAKNWLATNGTLRHKNAAAYFPRIKAADPLENNRQRSFPNSGAVAGLYARIDGARGVWKAPAGTEATLRGVLALDYTLTDPENGVLNPLGLNSLRNFPAFGPVVWGARTLEGNDQLASEWKYIPVRRLALFIEESLYRGTQWVVFEPNDEPLWAQIRLNVGSFMHNLFRQGAFQGKSPKESYLVKCDAETTTQNDINQGIVNIIVGFAPLKPAEFVMIKIQQLAGQVEA